MPVQFRVKTVLYIADDVIKQRDVLRKTLSEECLSVLNSSSPRRDPPATNCVNSTGSGCVKLILWRRCDLVEHCENPPYLLPLCAP